MKENTQPTRITQETETLEEAYEIARFESLSELEQRIYLLHQLDQFEAIPSYVERFCVESSSVFSDDSKM